MSDLHELLEKLRKVEALHRGATSDGERAAAFAARVRLETKLAEVEKEEVIEWRFSMADSWSRSLFLAILRKHGLKPYRYRRQRYSTVMCRATSRHIDEVVWPEYLEFSETLKAWMDHVTQKVIREVLRQEESEVDEMAGELPES